MVAEIKAYRTDDDCVFDTEEKARRHELKSMLVTVMSECGVGYSEAGSAATVLVRDEIEKLCELAIAYKKTLPANALAKQEQVSDDLETGYCEA